jgi:hypothetical protein
MFSLKIVHFQQVNRLERSADLIRIPFSLMRWISPVDPSSTSLTANHVLRIQSQWGEDVSGSSLSSTGMVNLETKLLIIFEGMQHRIHICKAREGTPCGITIARG